MDDKFTAIPAEFDYSIVVGDHSLRIDDNDDILLNGKPLETLEDHKAALGLLLRGLCHIVWR